MWGLYGDRTTLEKLAASRTALSDGSNLKPQARGIDRVFGRPLDISW
jgi:hypothetical protein